MANKNLNFVIALKFLTEGFSRQTSRVKAQVASLQRHFIALTAAVGAGGIGLSNFVSRLVETAKKTSQASIALQNVSGSMQAYAENQQWLLGLAKKYGVEINSLTLGYAKFKAAADISNMSLEDQRKIFESVSRATVSFGLSQEDQRGVFMALSQMMSKGKIMAEELRLQLAERMPVAIQAMAKAMGRSVTEMDKMMKEGKVLSSEVLPKFAQVLTEMTPNLNLDNLNKSLTDLSNTFTELTKNLNVEGRFKAMVDSANSALQWLAERTDALMKVITSLVVAGVGKVLNSAVYSVLGSWASATNSAVKAMERVASTRARMKTAEKEHGKDSIKYTRAAEAYARAQSKITTEVRLRNLAAYHTGWKSFVFSMRAGLASIGASLKALAASNVVTLIASGIFEIARLTVNAAKSWRELRSALKNTSDEFSAETKNLLALQKQLLDPNEDVRKGALSQINALLGARLETEQDINEAIADRIALEQAEAKLKRAEEARKIIGEKSSNFVSRGIAAMAAARSGTGFWEKWNEVRWQGFLNLAQQADTLEKEARDDIAKITSRINKRTNNKSTITTGGGGNPKPFKMIELAIDEKEVEDTLDELAKNFAKIKPQKNINPDLQPYIDSLISAQRDKSGDWKLSDIEILEADRIFEQERISKLLDMSEQVGNDMGDALSEALANSANLEQAIKAAELQDALKEAQKSLVDARVGMFEGAVEGINGISSAIERMTEAVEEGADGWERFQAMMGVFSAVAEGVATSMEAIGVLMEAQAQQRKVQAASNIAAAQGEAMAEGIASAATLPPIANVAAIATIVSTILSAFAMIPKFAKGGVVGGNSTSGDKVLARLNSGEGVLTALGMQSLHDASVEGNTRNIRVTGVLTGQGRTLKAIIDKEEKFVKLTK